MLKNTIETMDMKRQFIKSSTSSGANYEKSKFLVNESGELKKILRTILGKLSMFLFFFLPSFFFFLSAQTNMNLEIWSGINPAGWATLNVFVPYGLPQTTFQETANPGEGLA